MRKTTCKRLFSFVLAVVMLVTVLPSLVLADEKTGTSSGKTTLQEISESLNSKPYADYVKNYEGVDRGEETIYINATDYIADETTATVSVVSDYQGKSGKSLRVNDDGRVTWSFELPEEGMYTILIEYCSVSDKTNSIERTLYINGTVPFAEARYLLLKKTWVNEYAANGRFELDGNGNELRPTSTVLHEWHKYYMIDSKGYYANPFEFYFKKGVNTIALESVREDVVIGGITVYPYKDNISYDEYVSGKSEADTDKIIHINAETPTRTSDYTIYPIYDRKSSISEPQDAAKIMLNTIGAEKWVTAGQWVEYEFDVETAGLYEIVFRFRQNELAGMYTSRRLYVDGEVPFEEANYLKFNYSADWQVEAANNGADTFQFYFEPGHHTIRLEVTLGEMGVVVSQVSDVLDSINQDYLEIIKLTGANPDQYRDYGFGRVLPDVVRDLVIQGQTLREVVNYIENMANIKTQNSATLDEIQRMLIKMGTDESQIAKNITALKSNVGTLGEWIGTVSNQPLEIDWINIQPASAEKPAAEANMLQSFLYEIKQFIASFFTDYSSLGASTDSQVDEEAPTIDVWVSTGRDQAQIIRNLMDNDFGPKTGINASLKLVAGGTLLPSVLAGVGPEVALPGTGVDPINYAIRSAVLAVNPEAYEDQEGDDEKTKAYNAEMRDIFSNFHEVCERFTEAAIIPITLYGKTYGLPDSQSWPMMFYRTDILADLGLEVPKTWDELLAMIPVLQFNNMEIGLSQDYQMYLYQMGGDLWIDDGMRINLDSNLALESFETMCNMFTQYSLPATFDAANRFRSGELPIFISTYTTYNNIIIFATEIAGLWEFGPIPGFMQEDGTINNTALSGTSAIVMMAGAEEIEAAWEYMCWYTDTKFQVDFSNELVAILGPAAKNATANMEALEELPWTSREYTQLMKQMENTTAIPAYPGTYILARYTNFAFLDAYNNHADPAQSLLNHINAINKEITRKRTEFDLETLEIGQTLASKRLDQAAEAIEELDEATRNSAVIKAVLAAIASEEIEELRSAADALDKTNADLKKIASYLTDAANALESYLIYK
ncbi:MAG: extracellular solute-binding protein [Ruminococcaceae bacterium]|nr:extracellular solute-binding protein [Oscillospiraceae bacterium]